MEKLGIENVGHQILKYKKMIFEYYVEKDNLFIITSSLEFDDIVRLTQKNLATYLGNKTIRCCIGNVLFDIDKDAKVKMIKKQLCSKIKLFIERELYC